MYTAAMSKIDRCVLISQRILLSKENPRYIVGLYINLTKNACFLK